MAEERKRELALPPGTHAYVLDSTKGVVKLYVGPTVINQTGQDRPVKFNPKTFKFDECVLEESMQQNIVVPEGFYAVLTNPAKSKDGKSLIYPETGRAQDTPDLAIGLKENIPGPVNFALFAGQTCEIRRGHHLRSNEYLLIKIYNEEKAKENWTKAVVKAAESAPSSTPTTATHNAAPKDLAVGKQYNILGTEVAFYIPPTGVSVVSEGSDAQGKQVFVRAAETLEQLEYSILVDEDGNKQYPKGPSVVFPRPTQKFLTDKDGNRKFRAIEMNELQGIQLKFIDDVKLTYADGSESQHKAGDEVFVTGAKMPIYYPEEGHQVVKYDGKTIHYAAAVPEGEARYVMNRKTGEIRTVVGPVMLLPNPVTEIIVRRALSDYESSTWFPGADGKGSKDALEYNRWLRNQAAKEPTTRQGVVSEGNVERNGPAGAASPSVAIPAQLGYASVDSAAMNFISNVAPRAKMQESRQGKNQDAVLGDVAERKSTYNEPRTLTLASKYRGVPTIKLRQGYAIQVADADGGRGIFTGPQTILLDYGQTLDVLSLSTGKPKTTDNLFNTAYLNVANNKVTDVMEVETADLVKVQLRLIYNVNFEGDKSAWFTIENYVKYLCDHLRSVLKGKVRKVTVEEFYKNSTDWIRDTILGGQPQAVVPRDLEGKGLQNIPVGKRPGMNFPENGMRVTDVEVLQVQISDPAIGQLLSQAQHQVVQQNIQLAQARSRLQAVKEGESLQTEELEVKFKNQSKHRQFQIEEVADVLRIELAKISSTLTQQAEALKIKEGQEKLTDLEHGSELERKRLNDEHAALVKSEEQRLKVELIAKQTDAIVAQMQAVDPALAAALDSATARETLVKVASSLSFHQMFGAGNASEFVTKVFAGTPLQGLIQKAMQAAANGQKLPQPQA